MEKAKVSTFYLAARYSRRDELNRYKADLEAVGHRVPARWLKGEHQSENLSSAEAREYSIDDVEDIMDAHAIVCFTEHPRSDEYKASRGGRHVEFGIVMGLQLAHHYAAPKIFVVGPRENVFHCHPLVEGEFKTWGDFIEFVQSTDKFFNSEGLSLEEVVNG